MRAQAVSQVDEGRTDEMTPTQENEQRLAEHWGALAIASVKIGNEIRAFWQARCAARYAQFLLDSQEAKSEV